MLSLRYSFTFFFKNDYGDLRRISVPEQYVAAVLRSEGCDLLATAIDRSIHNVLTMAVAASDNPYNPFEGSFGGPSGNSNNPFDSEANSFFLNDSEALQTQQQTNVFAVDETLPAEASWQYLGDIPYRRVPIYANVNWAHRSRSQPGEDQLELHLNNLSTRLVGCPNGGPIATISVPLLLPSGDSNTFKQSELRLQTNSGSSIAVMDFPPSGLVKKYSAADVIALGFTSRAVLIVVLSDSLCFTFDLSLKEILPPFQILPGASTELQQATVYDGGVAVLAKNKASAIVELLDGHDDPTYAAAAHVAARTISPDNQHQADSTTYYALVTPLPTAVYASEHFLSYVTLAVLPRSKTGSHPEVFVSTTDNSVIVCKVDTTEITDVNCRSRISSPIVDLCIAPNGRFLACFTESSVLTVISTSFETKVLDFDTSEGSSAPPLAMKWCGEDSVVLYWKNIGILMVGPFGDWLRFPFEGTENAFIIPELDCCRVVTDTAVELLQRVPPATALLLRLGSIESSAMLLDAADAFAAGSPAADSAIRAIDPEVLVEAIETCVDAAAKEFDMVTQKRLLRAASYGLQSSYKRVTSTAEIMGGPIDGSNQDAGLLPSPVAVKFVNTCKKIRCMNQLRHPRVGFVLTSAQYDSITPAGVIARLCMMKRPSLAVALSKYLHLPHLVQLYARASKACAIVETDKDASDSELAEQAIQIINGSSMTNAAPSINRGAYAIVAMAASKCSRQGVANLLLMLESSVADKVPTLLANGSYADAIAVATAHRDGDYIFTIIMEYEKSCMGAPLAGDAAKAQSAFFATVASKFTPEAFHMLRRYLLAVNTVVKDAANLLLRAQRFTDAGSTIALRAVKLSDPRERTGMLMEASRVFASGKETSFQKSCTDDQIELLKDLETLKTKYAAVGLTLEPCSVIETISLLLRAASLHEREQHRLLSDVDKVARKYRVSEKRLWAAKVKAFSESSQWSNLRALAESKKSPIGYKLFARAAIRGKQPISEVLRYITRVTVPEEKYDLLLECKLWKDALEEAFKLKEERRILNVKSLCNDTDLQIVADQMLGRIA
jgi:vacuolar protein sorting-associated protein 16